jgi:hypothetical protein
MMPGLTGGRKKKRVWVFNSLPEIGLFLSAAMASGNAQRRVSYIIVFLGINTYIFVGYAIPQLLKEPGESRGIDISQPLTAPSTMPWRKYFLMARKSRIAGTMITTQAAASSSSWFPSRTC